LKKINDIKISGKCIIFGVSSRASVEEKLAGIKNLDKLKAKGKCAQKISLKSLFL